MLVAVLAVLCVSTVTCTLSTCRTDCERGVIRPSNEVINHVGVAFATIKPATADLATALLNKMNALKLCDEEKQTIMTSMLQNRINKCAACQNPAGMKALFDTLNQDVAAITASCSCKPVSQFYIDRFFFNSCVAAGAADCSDEDNSSKFKHGSGRRGHNSSNRGRGRRGPRSLHKGGHHSRKDSSSDESGSIHLGDSRRVEVLPGSDSSGVEFFAHAFEQDGVLANVRMDVHVQFCAAINSQVSYASFPGAYICTASVGAQQCAKYETDLKALINHIDAYQKKALECINDLKKEINDSRDKAALEQVSKK